MVKVVEKEFNVELPEEEFQPNANVSIGQLAPVITDDNPTKIQLLRFGMIPFWSKKAIALFNARAEGDHNKDNNPDYSGAKGIITKPSFRKPIRSQRCLVLANAYIEGTTKSGLDEPFLVYLPQRTVFAFAGIWDEWENPENKDVIKSFSIITTVANSLIQRIPHHRMPVILSKSYEKKWLNIKTDLSDITQLLNPYPSEKMNAYPISVEIKNPKNNSRDFIKTLGKSLQKGNQIETTQKLELHGMGHYKRKL
jgi:putative SOS response-associated peptidase YedK